MATSKAVCVLYVLLSLSYVLCEVEDLQSLVQSTEETMQKAKTHVEHMFNLSPIPNEDKLHPVVKNESEHMAYEIKKLATKLHEKISAGEHKPEVKAAVDAAVTHINEAAATLEHVGSDLKQENTKYYEAANKVFHELKNIVASGPCPELSPVVKGALHELAHDVNNYQFGIHDLIGPHEGGPDHGGHHDGHNHHVHTHGAKSSEESNESGDDHHHHHHHHHHH